MNIRRNFQCVISTLALASTVLYSSSGEAGTWTAVQGHPGLNDGVCNPLLQTDGTVLMQGMSGGVANERIWQLAPDAFGNYSSGTWKQLASLPVINGVQYAPFAHASAVLPTGHVVFVGGEYNGSDNNWTGLGAIYHPRDNYWSPLYPPSFFPAHVGDAPGVVLPDGTFMVGASYNKTAALLDLTHSTWTQVNMTGKTDINDEEGWTLLPNGHVLTIDCWGPKGNRLPALSAEFYNYPEGGWTRTPDTQVSLSNSYHETGAAVLMTDGNVLAIGANGNTGIYDYRTNTWAIGPSLPVINGQQLGMADGPAALLPNGNVLVAVSPLTAGGASAPPLHIFEYDGNDFIQQPDMPGTANNPSESPTMLILPNGRILVTHRSSDVQLYVPNGTYNSAWQPQITNTSNKINPSTTYRVDGVLFNGMSQGAMYGDDFQSATNYPLVRITNLANHHVVYCRTHGHSSMAVAAVGVPAHTFFDVPATIDPGYSMLEVVANGIPSLPFYVVVSPELTPAATATPSQQTIHSGNATNIVFTSTIGGTTFSWPAPSQTNVSGGMAGSGSSLAQILTLTTLSSGQAVYTITPTANGIQGKPIKVTITVNQ